MAIVTCSAIVRIKLNDLCKNNKAYLAHSTQILATNIRYFVIAYCMTGVGGILLPPYKNDVQNVLR